MTLFKLAVLLLFAMLLTSCSSKPVLAPSFAFSTFDMSEIITKAGSKSEGFSDSGTSNAVTGIATHIRSGMFTSAPDCLPSYAVFTQIREHFEETHGVAIAQEGWNPDAEEHPSSPCHIVMKYTHQGRHGELNLWLFPEEDHLRTGFALYYQEKPSS